MSGPVFQERINILFDPHSCVGKGFFTEGPESADDSQWVVTRGNCQEDSHLGRQAPRCSPRGGARKGPPLCLTQMPPEEASSFCPEALGAVMGQWPPVARSGRAFLQPSALSSFGHYHCSCSQVRPPVGIGGKEGGLSPWGGYCARV